MEIEFENVTFGYKNDRTVLHDISLKMESPGLVCIIGPNGVGKSTLIKCMNGLIKPTSGTVRINGKDVKDYSPDDLAEFMGYVPVTAQDVFSMPVFDAVMMGRYKRKKWRNTDEDYDACDRTLRLMELSDLAMHSFNELSAGQHQKVAMARGIVREPQLLVLDEPTSNLDVRHQVYVTDLLHELSKQFGMLVVMISHDLNIAAKYADRLIVMGTPGIIRAEGPVSEVLTEDLIREVYGVESEVVYRNSRPHVILGDAIDMGEEQDW